MFQKIGERGGEGRDGVQEDGHRGVAGVGMQGADAVLDAGGAGAVQDEQQPGEERIPLPPRFFRGLGGGVPAASGSGAGYVAVEAGVGGEFGGQALAGPMVARSTSKKARRIVLLDR
ncbi:hypothetical protein ACFT9I_16445 [Streptomyces sp. NPDC057137]|uniref:hypothetical protein n=1 Tax=Streptomyces sp. NPDC057137 TaxID=3346030 RepID=UPI0036253C62